MWQWKNSKEKERLKENGGQMKIGVPNWEVETGRLLIDQI